MARNLSQSNPAITTLTDLFTATRLTTIESVIITNTGADSTYRVSLAINGAADSLSQYIHYDQSLLSKNTLMLELGILVKSGDVLRGYAGNASFIFQVFGVEK